MTRNKTATAGLGLLIVLSGCSQATTEPTTSTTPAVATATTAEITSTAPPQTTTTVAVVITTTAEPTTTVQAVVTTTAAAIVFPQWRIPTHGGTSAVVYVGFAEFGSDGALDVMDAAHARLAEIGQDAWEGYGSLTCDFGAQEALGGPDGLTVGAYFDTEDEAVVFAEAWEAYFGEPPYGVVASVETFCLD